MMDNKLKNCGEKFQIKCKYFKKFGKIQKIMQEIFLKSCGNLKKLVRQQ